MNALIFFALVIMVGLAAVRALLPARPTQPQVIYVVAEQRAPTWGRPYGCLPLAVAGVVVVVALRLLGGA